MDFKLAVTSYITRHEFYVHTVIKSGHYSIAVPVQLTPTTRSICWLASDAGIEAFVYVVYSKNNTGK